MNKTWDWPERLYEYIQSKTDTPFEWGVHDCCTFAAGAIEAMTGESPFKASYTNEFEANTFMKSVGGIETWITERFGEPVVPLAARRGDIGLLALDDRELLAVVIGDTVCAPGEKHILYYPITMLSKAWRVE